MEIRLTTALQPVQPSKGVADLLERLRPGENISAIVENQLAEDSFLLRLTDSGQTLRAQSQLDLTPGQALKLEVVKLGATPELRIVPQETPETPETVAVQQAFRQLLPKQLQLGDLAISLREALNPKATQNAPALPEPLRNLVKTVLEALPQKGTLVTPEGLKQAAENSGLFLEARLAARPDAAGRLAGRDLKGSLLALNEALKVLIKAADGKSPPGAAEPTALTETAGKPGVSASAPQPAAGKVAADPAPKTSTEPLKSAASGETRTLADAMAEPGGMDSEALPTGTRPQGLSGAAPAGVAEGEQDHTPAPQSAHSPAPSAAGKAGSGGTIENPAFWAATKPGENADGKPHATPSAESGPGTPKAPEAQSSTAESKAAARLATQLPLPDQAKPGAPARPADAKPAPAPQADAKETPLPRGEYAPRAETSGVREALPRPTATVPAAMDMPDAMAKIKSLQQHTEGAIARIVLDQLASLPQPEGKPMVWHMEIPFTDDGRSDSAKLKVVREGPRTAQPGQAYWSVILEISPPGLGTIHSRINLCGERVDTYFWSEVGSTSSLIAGNLDLLAARMQQAGLSVGELNTLPGAPSGADPNDIPLASLVDERA